MFQMLLHNILFVRKAIDFERGSLNCNINWGKKSIPIYCKSIKKNNKECCHTSTKFSMPSFFLSFSFITITLLWLMYIVDGDKVYISTYDHAIMVIRRIG